MPRGVGIGKHLIDLSGLQRNLVALVLQADNKLLGRCFHGKSVDIALDLELPAPDAMSFVPVYLREPSSAIRKADTGNTLSFSPVTAPKGLEPMNLDPPFNTYVHSISCDYF